MRDRKTKIVHKAHAGALAGLQTIVCYAFYVEQWLFWKIFYSTLFERMVFEIIF